MNVDAAIAPFRYDLSMHSAYEMAVRRMLRHARKPAALAKLQLVNDLCAAIGVGSPTAMLRSVVDASFAPFPNDRPMHELLVRCDLEGGFKQSAFAAREGFSRRRFDATRREAIRRVADHVGNVLANTAGGREDIIIALAGALSAVNPVAASAVYALAQRRH